jgi:vesicular inhibitory amino acid transporter
MVFSEPPPPLFLTSFVFFISGTGTLGIPYAISQGGYASIFAMVFVALLTNYTGKLIVDCLYAKQRGVKVRVRQGYADLGKALLPIVSY